MNQTTETEPTTETPPPPPPPAPDESAPPADEGEHPNAPPPPPPPATPEQKEAAAKAEAANKAERAIIPLEPQTFDDFYRWSRWAASTQFVPKEVRNRPNDVMYMVMMGRQWGLSVMASLQLYVITTKGVPKVCLPASILAGLIMKSPLCEYLELIDIAPTHATWATKRRGGRREILRSFTYEAAERMGLVTKGSDEGAAARNQWARMPDVMCQWRALSAIARAVYPDLMSGLYTVEEIADEVAIEGGEMVVQPLTERVMRAKDGTAPAPPGLAESTDDTPEAMAAAFRAATAAPPIPSPPLEPIRLGVADRARAQAAAVREAQSTERPVETTPPVANNGKTCEDCGLPFKGSGKKCPACK